MPHYSYITNGDLTDETLIQADKMHQSMDTRLNSEEPGKPISFEELQSMKEELEAQIKNKVDPAIKKVAAANLDNPDAYKDHTKILSSLQSMRHKLDEKLNKAYAAKLGMPDVPKEAPGEGMTSREPAASRQKPEKNSLPSTPRLSTPEQGRLDNIQNRFQRINDAATRIQSQLKSLPNLPPAMQLIQAQRLAQKTLFLTQMSAKLQQSMIFLKSQMRTPEGKKRLDNLRQHVSDKTKQTNTMVQETVNQVVKQSSRQQYGRKPRG